MKHGVPSALAKKPTSHGTEKVDDTDQWAPDPVARTWVGGHESPERQQRVARMLAGERTNLRGSGCGHLHPGFHGFGQTVTWPIGLAVFLPIAASSNVFQTHIVIFWGTGFVQVWNRSVGWPGLRGLDRRVCRRIHGPTHRCPQRCRHHRRSTSRMP